MSVSLQQLNRAEPAELATAIRNAGLAGAGGAGFPTHGKWARLDEVDYLLVNHQESEPNYYIDKWLGREYADELATVFDALLDQALETVIVGTKAKDRDRWTEPLERATDATVYGPEDLPLDPEAESGVVVAYTDDRYEYGMESVLLRLISDVVMGDDLPMDHGWIVQNTETLFNFYRTFEADEPVTRKLVHVDGEVPRHRFLDVPVGTSATDLLDAAGTDPDALGEQYALVDGGPGWCFEIAESPDEFGVTKRTNCVLVVRSDVVEKNTLGDERINVLSPYEWGSDAVHETEPTRLDPDRVRVPLITNPNFEGIVERSEPIVEPGDAVEAGETIARPAGEISNAHHASIGGEVAAVTDDCIEIRTDVAEDGGGSTAREGSPFERPIYWTWCIDCGAYVAMPGGDRFSADGQYVCEDCR